MKPGTYKAHPIDWAIEKNSKGKFQAVVLFKLESGEERKWFGHIQGGEKAKAIAMKALLTLGMRTNNLSDLASGVKGGALDATQPVNLVIEREVNPTDNKEYDRVKWVNRLGAGLGEGVTDPTELSVLDGLSGDLMAARQDGNFKAAESYSQEDDVGF